MSMQKLSFYSVQIGKGITWEEILSNLLAENSVDAYCIVNEETNEYITGCYIVKVMQNQTQYNIETAAFESIAVERTQILKFDLYISKSILVLWGNRKLTTLFSTALERASKNTIVIEIQKSDYKRAILNLLHTDSVVFKRMKIIDVIIEHGIIANCIIHLNNQENIDALIKKYIDQISQVTVFIGTEEDGTSLTWYATGSIIVYRDRDDISSTVISEINHFVGGIL